MLFSPRESFCDGLLVYIPQAITFADELFDRLLQSLPWQQPRIQVYGKQHAIPRLQSWHGDPQAQYRYSGQLMTPEPWTPELQQLRSQVAEFGLSNCNSVLCNLYRHGQDCMGWHSDDEPELAAMPIVSISLGAQRDFAIRHKGSQRMHSKLALQHGSVVIMQPEFQGQWQHSLPRRAGINQPRINLTFRQVRVSSG